jgi:hypothetical protein
MGLFALLMLYPRVSTVSLSIYSCTSVHGIEYLTLDMHAECGSPDWTVRAGFNAVFLLLYPIGLPVLFVLLVAR